MGNHPVDMPPGLPCLNLHGISIRSFDMCGQWLALLVFGLDCLDSGEAQPRVGTSMLSTRSVEGSLNSSCVATHTCHPAQRALPAPTNKILKELPGHLPMQLYTRRYRGIVRR
eukprot:6459755-Amphidinium_carterae.1